MFAVQIQRLLQDVGKCDFQIDTLKEQLNEAQKKEDSLRRQLDKLTYDNNSLQVDLTTSRNELDEARQSLRVSICESLSHMMSALL